MPCNDPSHMDAPVQCYDCGKCIELSEANFCVKGYCYCMASCIHGLCDDCKTAVEKEGEDLTAG